LSAIIIRNQRETVKDMVLAGYQIPKGVSTYSAHFRFENFLFWNEFHKIWKQFDHKRKSYMVFC